MSFKIQTYNNFFSRNKIKAKKKRKKNERKREMKTNETDNIIGRVMHNCSNSGICHRVIRECKRTNERTVNLKKKENEKREKKKPI